MDPSPATGAPAPARLGHRAAVALVFGSSAAVLVVELTALRLLAPYLGLTLETNTLVIGIALGAIAVGSWTGGRLADQVDPYAALGPLLGVSGVVVALTPVLVRSTAEASLGLVALVSALTIIVPGALLSAVTPMVTKLRLTSLAETGTVVGRLSGWGTVGGIAGTVLTGFVLVSRLPVSTILVGLGVLLVLSAVFVQWRTRALRSRALRTAAVPLLLVTGGGLGAAYGPGGCDAETTYHCAIVLDDPEREDGRRLVLDGVSHSYVDLRDPTYLEFDYVRALAAVADTSWPAGEPLDAYHLGGGGVTFPRYLAATRPGTASLVSEIDGGIVRLDRDRLGLDDPTIAVRVEDGRLGLRRLDDDSRDLVVGDAFSGVSVPWHLTTREAVAEVQRVLRPDGVYAVNLIDHGPMDFARAEIATLREAFDHVVVTVDPADLDLADPSPTDGGNLVVVASDRAFDTEALDAALRERDTGWSSVTDTAGLDGWLEGAEVLTDDHAPVDQLLQPYGAPAS